MSSLPGIVFFIQAKCFKMYVSEKWTCQNFDKYMFLINQHVFVNVNMCHVFLQRILFLSTKNVKWSVC